MPKKRGAASVKGFADAEAKFLQRTAAAIAAHVNFAVVRCLLLAGPGFARDKLRQHLLSEGAAAEGAHVWAQHKDAILSVPASTAYLQAIPVRACFLFLGLRTCGRSARMRSCRCRRRRRTCKPSRCAMILSFAAMILSFAAKLWARQRTCGPFRCVPGEVVGSHRSVLGVAIFRPSSCNFLTAQLLAMLVRALEHFRGVDTAAPVKFGDRQTLAHRPEHPTV